MEKLSKDLLETIKRTEMTNDRKNTTIHEFLTIFLAHFMFFVYIRTR